MGVVLCRRGLPVLRRVARRGILIVCSFLVRRADMRPRREVLPKAQVVGHVCHHSCEHRVCEQFAAMDVPNNPGTYPTLNGKREYIRVFGVVASRTHDIVTIVQSTHAFRKPDAGAAIDWTHDPTAPGGMRDVCSVSTFEELQAALYGVLGVGFEDVVLFVPGFDYSVKFSAVTTANLRRKVPLDATTCCFFSFNCSLEGLNPKQRCTSLHMHVFSTYVLTRFASAPCNL